MSEISRRRALLGLAAALGVAATPTTVLTLSEAEAQTPGMERRQERREDRRDRREERRAGRWERREGRWVRREERRADRWLRREDRGLRRGAAAAPAAPRP